MSHVEIGICVGTRTFPRIIELGMVDRIVSTNRVPSCHNKVQLQGGTFDSSPILRAKELPAPH